LCKKKSITGTGLVDPEGVRKKRAASKGR